MSAVFLRTTGAGKLGLGKSFALGIGVTTAIFTLVRGLLWAPLPVPEPTELPFALDQHRHRPFLFSAPTVRRLEAGPELSGRVIASMDNTPLAFRRGAAPAELFTAQFVNSGCFSALQFRAAQGRRLIPADDHPDQPRAVAVISWSWWQRKLGGDPAVIGRPLRLNGDDVTVVGVVRAGFVRRLNVRRAA